MRGFSRGREHAKAPTLLIMDNDRMALSTMTRVFASALPDITILPPVTQGTTAIRQCTDTTNPPSLLLADIAMNDINGPLVVRAIRRDNSTTAILAITASVVQLHAEDMAKAGAQGIISKNDDPRLQAMAIRQVLGGGTWDTPSTSFQTTADAHERLRSSSSDELSARETEVTDLWSRGFSVPDIASELGINGTTVRTHLTRAAHKLGAGNLKEMIGIWIRMNAH